MGRILLNSGGGIHVEDGQIMLLPQDRTTESCACCGPPQPPPPECTRCYRLNTSSGLYEFYAPTPLDFQVAISVANSSQTFEVEAWVESQLESSGTFGPRCEHYRMDFFEQLVVNGLDGVQGTYIGLGSPNSPNIISPSCAGPGEPTSPYDLTPPPGCTTLIPCDYVCDKLVWLQDTPISGTYTCSRSQVITFNPGNVASSSVSFSVNLTGWLRVFGGYAGAGVPFLPFSMVGSLSGSTIDGYGVSRSVEFQWNNGSVTPFMSGRILNEPPCTPFRVTPFNFYFFSCKNTSLPPPELCMPYWRRTWTGVGTTCDDVPTALSHTINYTGCEEIDEYNSPVGATISCGPLYNSGYHRRTVTPFSATATGSWTAI